MPAHPGSSELNRRHYQIFALTILIGAPLLISSLAGYLPHDAPAASDNAATARPDYMTPAADPIADLKVQALPDPPPAQPNYGPPANLTGNATLDPQPTLDPSGGAVDGVDPAMPPPVVATAPLPAPAMPQPSLSTPALAQNYAPPPQASPLLPFREGPTPRR